MNASSIMSQFETKYACFMCATEFPGSDRISLGNIVAATIFPSDRISCDTGHYGVGGGVPRAPLVHYCTRVWCLYRE